MTAKDYLKRAYRLNDKIKSNLRQIEDLEADATKVTVSFGEKVQSGEKNSTEQLYIKLIEAKEKLYAETDRYVDTKEEIKKTIDKVTDPDENLLLTLRYIEFMRWEVIAEKMHFSQTQVFRIHREALKSVEYLISRQ